MWLHKWVYLIGKEIRNPRMKVHEKELLETDFASLEELKSLQLKRLRHFLKHAKIHSKFYQERLKNIDVDNITIEGLIEIPVLTKDDFRSNINEIQNYIEGEKFFTSSTSGSSGKALTFDRNLDWDAATRAAQMRSYSWYGIKPWMKNLYFWGYNPDFKKLLKIRFTDFLVNRYRVFSYNEKTLHKVKKYLKTCVYIEGYSSSIYSLAQRLEKEKWLCSNIKMVKGTSEKIYDSYQEPMHKVFAQNIVSEYGAAETGIIAFECPHGSMHIAMENVIVEEIDSKIIVTNLFSMTAPIIRYELGDYVEFDYDKKCECGREHPIIKEVTGRIGDKVYGNEGEYPSLVMYYVFKNIVQRHNIIMSYYACQKEKGVLDIEVIYEGQEKEKVLTYIEHEKQNFFKDDIVFNVTFIQEIEQKARKTQSFESFINRVDKN